MNTTNIWTIVGTTDGKIYGYCSSEGCARNLKDILDGYGLEEELCIQNTGMYLDTVKIGDDRIDLKPSFTLKELFEKCRSSWQYAKIYQDSGNVQTCLTYGSVKDILQYYTELLPLPVKSWEINECEMLIVHL